jgi:hypothetical protein
VIDIVRGANPLDLALWFLADTPAHDGCSAWVFDTRTRLICRVYDTTLYEFNGIRPCMNSMGRSTVQSPIRVTGRGTEKAGTDDSD